MVMLNSWSTVFWIVLGATVVYSLIAVIAVVLRSDSWWAKIVMFFVVVVWSFAVFFFGVAHGSFPIGGVGLYTPARPPVSSSESGSWLIQSYDNGILIAQHIGNTYKATCDSEILLLDVMDSSQHGTMQSPVCNMASDVVGQSVQEITGHESAGETTIKMSRPFGDSLSMQNFRFGRLVRLDAFKITSVSKSK